MEDDTQTGKPAIPNLIDLEVINENPSEFSNSNSAVDTGRNQKQFGENFPKKQMNSVENLHQMPQNKLHSHLETLPSSDSKHYKP